LEKKIGILGGTFNPPHIAHSIAAQQVTEELQLDKILFIPSGNHPLKESIDAEHRLAMARLAFSNNEKFEVSDIEIASKEVKSYTVNTLEKLRNIYDAKLFLIIGADNLLQLPKWKDPEKLFDLSEVVVINRPEYELEDPSIKFSGRVKFVTIPFLQISSSMIREFVRTGKSIRYLVDDLVRNYIKENNLYR
jgi:nicotinate-nucleotide adenylyltransferase